MYSIKATNENIKQLVKEGIEKYGPKADLNYIDTSAVTDMSHLFSWGKFNGDISKWNVSNVINMERMFSYSLFNGDISEWDVRNVVYMEHMFRNSKFNADISKWKTYNLCNTKEMFYNSLFNQDINKWDIHYLNGMTDMTDMFNNKIYDQEITWDVDLEELFGDDYDNYLERWKTRMLKELCIV